MNLFKTSSNEEDHQATRQQILTNLLDCVKICQTKFGGRNELATESDSQVIALCQCLENVLTHGLRVKGKNSIISLYTVSKNNSSVTFWDYVQLFLTRHEVERYICLKKVNTDIGRGRAWLRSALNERCLERYFNSLLSHTQEAHQFYYDWALILDQDLNSVLPNTAAGLSSILFAISIDEERFNEPPIAESISSTHYQTEPIVSVNSPENQSKSRKKKPAQVVSFEEPEAIVVEPETVSEVFFVKNAANSASPSSNEESFPDFEGSASSSVVVEVQTLTPIREKDVGELMLISSNDSQNEHSSFSEDSCEKQLESLLQLRGNLTASQEQLESLINALEQLRDSNLNYKERISATGLKHRKEIGKLENKLTTIIRENEVLKHQLRKYVGAVQMLNKDGAAHEALAYLEASQVIKAQKEEATRYQDQLVQVAQMHGELMEFNDRLQRQLAVKEDALKRLERELAELRGPLPEDDGPFPDALVNIWIPSAFLSGGSGGIHHLYQIYVRIRDAEWNVYRRYSQFYALHRELKKEYVQIGGLDFPPKKTLGNKDTKFVEDRRQRLQRYLRQAVDFVVRNRNDLADRQNLIRILPFFSENFVCSEKSSKEKKNARKNRREFVDPTQYNGL